MKNVVFIIAVAFMPFLASAQNFSSINDGSFTLTSNWNNTSGWGSSTPPIDGTHGSGTITMQNNMSVGSAYNLGSVNLNIAANKTLTVNGNFVGGGGSTVTVNGTLNIHGDLTINQNINIAAGGTVNVYGNVLVSGGATRNITGNFNIVGNLTLNGGITVQPGGTVIVNSSATVNSAEYLVIGTNVAAPPFASMAIYQNLISNSSGDVRIRQNGRLAVFGNFSGSNSGGTVIRLDDDADLFINGTSTFTGGNDHISNNNNASSWGFYTDNTPTYSGGGSNTNGAAGSSAVQPVSSMQSDNPVFYNWIMGLSGNPLPVTLLFFKVKNVLSQQVNLIWATATEVDFSHYNILRSFDGNKFEVIGTVAGSGTSVNRIDYSFTDHVSWIGSVYYALQAVDLDGSSETFKVIKTVLIDDHHVNFFPDAANSRHLHMTFNYTTGAYTSIFAYDMNGRMLFQSEIEPGTSEYLIEHELPTGMVVIKVYSEEITSAQRVLIR